jgi:hypothetical protein
MTLRDDDERSLIQRMDDLELSVAQMQKDVFDCLSNTDAIGLRTEILIHRYNAEQSAIENNWSPNIDVK